MSGPYSNSSVPQAPKSENYCCTVLKTIVERNFILRDTITFMLTGPLKLTLLIKRFLLIAFSHIQLHYKL